MALAPTRLSPSAVAMGLGLLLVAMVTGVTLGAADLPVGAVLRELASVLPGIDPATGLDDTGRNILWNLRLPRVVLGALVGASLGTAGAAYQGVFRNPLADPYLLGAASGAGLAATLSIVWFRDLLPGGLTLPVFAFVGAVGGVALAWGVARSTGRSSSATLILAGVAVSYFLTAFTTWVQQRNVETIRDVYSFILGQLGTGGWTEVVRLALPGSVAVFVIWRHRRVLDVMAVGEQEAASLGVDTGRVRLRVIAAASLATAAAVSVSGLIGFVGVLVPHAVRLAVGGSYRIVVPMSVLVGGAFLVACDVVARTIAAPAELPIGVVTALVGAPFFAWVLRRGSAGVTS